MSEVRGADRLPLAWAVPTPSLCVCPDVLSAPGPIGSAPPTSPLLPSAPPLKAHPHQAEVLGSWGRGLRTGILGARLPNRSGRRAGPWADVAALQCLGDAGRVASLDPGLKSAPELETLALTPTCGFHSLAHCAEAPEDKGSPKWGRDREGRSPPMPRAEVPGDPATTWGWPCTE